MGRDGLCCVRCVQGCPTHQSMFTLHGSTTITYCKKNKPSSLSLQPRKSHFSLPFTARGIFRPSLSHCPTAAVSNNRLVKQNWTEDDRRQIVGWKKVHIFSKAKSWERGSLYLCFLDIVSVSSMQNPSHEGGQVYWAINEIKKKTVACVANLRSDYSLMVSISYISDYKSSGSAAGAYTCRCICWGRKN